MTARAIARSSARTSWLRYRRSLGLWLMLIVAPVGARFMISGEDGHGVMIAIDDHLPVLTWPVIGVWLGIVVSTLLIPIAYAYLRANTTRRQPWQVEEVTAASRIAIALGRFAADAGVLLLVLAALTLAGWVLAALLVPGGVDPLRLALALWMVAAPTLIGIAAIRTFFDAVPVLRRWPGDLLFIILWFASIAMPAAIEGRASTFATNIVDFEGYYRPIVAGSATKTDNFAIGSTDLKPGRVTLDVMAGLSAPGYAQARAAWVGIAVALVVLAGLLYRPHRPARHGRVRAWLGRAFAVGPPKSANPAAAPAHRIALPPLGLIVAEMRLIGAGRGFKLLALAAGLLGLLGDFRHIGSPAGLLLLVFALSSQAGRSEARGLLALTRTAPLSPMLRRAAFLLAGTMWAVLLSVPAAIAHRSADLLLLGLETGAAATSIAMLLGALTGSAFAPRIVLLIIWYGYLSS